MDFWIAKHNGYSSHNARIYALTGSERADGIKPSCLGNQAERKRFIKQHIWPRLPGRAFFFFLYMYFFRLGFLDGVHGFHFCVMHAVFQQFVVVKQWERKHSKQGAPQKVNQVAETSESTGRADALQPQ
jgi:hypothetical protein